MPHPPITHNDGKTRGQWNTAAIHTLLADAFSDEELTTLCFDHFRPVYDGFADGMSREKKILRLMEYCDRHDQLEKLIELVKTQNPSKHEKHKPYQQPANATQENVLFSRARQLLDQDSLDKAIELLKEIRSADPQNKQAKPLYLEALYRKGVRSYVREHKLLQARYAFQEVVSIDPLYEDTARLLHEVEQHLKPRSAAAVSAHQKWRTVRRILLVSAAILVALVAAAVVLWPRVNLSDARVGFSITLSNGDKIPVPISNTITLAPGDMVVIETSVTTNSSPFPRALSFQYYAPRGRVAKASGPRTSYVAPAQPGSDVITVSVTDQVTGDMIQRHLNIIVKEKE